MRKVIINLCRWIIKVLDVRKPKREPMRRYNKGVWVIYGNDNASFCATHKAAAETISRLFNTNITCHSVSNALYKRDGKIYNHKQYLCRVSNKRS